MYSYIHVTLFMVAKTWRKKMWYIYTMEYYSATRKDKILTFVTT